jgi:hypothetical protein
MKQHIPLKSNTDLTVKLCKACLKELPLKHFHQTGQGKIASRCKSCKLNGNLIPKKPKPEKKGVRSYENPLRLDCPKPSDYTVTYLFLEQIGYEPSKDIHMQFINKWNKLGANLTYKKKFVDTEPLYLYDGTLNTKAKNANRKKTPTD